MENLKCIYYDKVLQKNVPCFINPGKLYTDADGKKMVNIIYDRNLFNDFNISLNELYRYSKDKVRILDLYPNLSTEQLEYAISCIPNKIPNQSTFKEDELKRIYTLVDMILNSFTINHDIYSRICDFVSYEILFVILDQIDRQFMLYIAKNQLNNENIGPLLEMFGGAVPCKTFLKICYNIFSHYTDDTVTYNIQNIINLSDVIYTNAIEFPIEINLSILIENVNFLQNGGYLEN